MRLNKMSEIMTKSSAEVTRFISLLDRIEKGLERMSEGCKPLLAGERYITDRELCKRLNVSDRTTQEWRNNGKIAYVQFEGKGKVMYAESQVEKFIQSHYQRAWVDDY